MFSLRSAVLALVLGTGLLPAASLGAWAQLSQPISPVPHRHMPGPPPPIRPSAFRSRSSNFSPDPNWQFNLLSVTPPPSSSSWVPIGPGPLFGGTPAYSGRIAAIAADPANANTLYVGAAGGGVWKTTDGGSTWTALTDDQSTLAIGAIAVAPSNTSVIYAGTGEANFSSDSAYGSGVLKSTDGGSTWTLLGSSVFNLACISKIVVNPTDPNTVYAAVVYPEMPSVWGTPISTGIYKSTDGGSTWTNTTSSITTYNAFTDLVMDPTNSQTLYAAIGDEWGTFYSATNGIYKSTDGGSTWAAAGNFPMGGNDGRIALTICQSSPQTLYAAVADQIYSGNGQLLEMLKTTDGGATWTQLSSAPNYMGGSGYGQGWYDTALAVDPSNPNVVYAGGSSNGGTPNIIESTDGGTTWNDISSGSTGGPHTDEHALVFDANGKLLSGSDGGIWRLANHTPGSISWTDINGNLETIQFIGVALHPTNASIAYGGSQDNGTEEYTGSVGWDLVIGGDGGHVRVDQSNPSTLYHTFTGLSIQRSDNGGSSWSNVTTGINTSDPSNFYIPYIMDPANSARLLLGTNHVYETTSKGNSWTAIGTPGVNNFNPSNYDVDCLAVNGSTIYVGVGGSYASSSQIFVTTNDGAGWTNVTPSGVSTHFADLAVDPTNSQSVYVVADRFGGSRVLVSSNGGASWTDITGNLPNLPVNAVKYDPTTTTLYVGTDVGVYSSTSAGVWNLFGSGLANARVVDLELNTALGILAAGTHGRSMWEISLGNNNPVPVLSKIAPTSANAGGPAFTLTATGSSFVASSTIDWNGTALTTTFVSATKLTASVPAADIAGAGTAHVTVVTPSPGGGTSASKSFKILLTTLNLVSANLSRNSTTGVYTATVSLKNVGFKSASSVKITRSSLGAANTSTTLPVTVGTIAAGATSTASLNYSSSAGAQGAKVTLKVSGTFTGGTFSGSLKVTLP